MPAYDNAQLARWFGSETLLKGLDYQDRVRWIRSIDGMLEADVQGASRRPYRVTIAFARERPGDPRSEPAAAPLAACSCPMVMNCKHVVATLLVWKLRGDFAPDPASASGPGVRPTARASAGPTASQEAHRAPPDAPGATLAAAAADATPAGGALSHDLRRWLDELESTRGAAAGRPRAGTRAPRPPSETLVYLVTHFDRGLPSVIMHKARLRKDGSLGEFGHAWDNLEQSLQRPAQFIRPEDLEILRLLWLGRARVRGLGYTLEGANGAETLRRIVASGRGFAADSGQFGLGFTAPLALSAGPTRSARIDWHESGASTVQPALHCAELDQAAWLPLQPWWYIDLASGRAGPLELPCDGALLRKLLDMPPAPLDALPALRAAFAERLPGLPPPPELAIAQARRLGGPPQALLQLSTRQAYGIGQAPWIVDDRLDFATVSFDYGGVVVTQAPSPSLQRDRQGELVRLERDRAAEQARLAELAAHGLVPLPLARLHVYPSLATPAFAPPRPEGWPVFVADAVPVLRALGWRVWMDDDFRHHALRIDEIEGSLREGEPGWFDLELGVRVNGEPVRLEPLLTALFARDPRWLGGGLEEIEDQELLELKAPGVGRLLLPAARLKPLVRALIDLFQGGEGLRVPRNDRGRLELLADSARWQFAGEGALYSLARRLRESPGVQPVASPPGLQAVLRPYQLEGLAWMQFLRAQELSGVLADDMGLGKTVQALAHVLAEQAAGRLDRPALVLMPTSLIGNWRSEAARFAPGLRVLDLHGPQRHARFTQIAQHDLVLSTYPLVWRDQEVLAAQPWHLLILDEAQQVKNASGRAAAAIRALAARHRLCLTGTPLENHLGELWSQFDFLLPGFLGSQRDFNARWRNPIERGRDGVRAQLLARRVRPFLLRRRKEDVAAELPPKVETVRLVEFEDAQRDLYETVRAAMQRQVVEAIQRQGLGRSHILLLEALLKLRQVCCDPRLVAQRRGSAAATAGSAKLELLMEMLPELIDEGRRILVFSQFTSMLSLIGQALGAAGIQHVTLTGDTSDRDTPVKIFQSGAVPVFLISLRAGGVGLNLTAADTVIHYDPWWNPAVERQATDRAHRIGQTGTVFVYKLIAAGTVEEKIMALQQRKSALADAILGEGATRAARFSEADLDALFAPLPALPARA